MGRLRARAAIVRPSDAQPPSIGDALETYFIDGLSDAQAEKLEGLGERYDELDVDGVFEQAFLRHLRKQPDDFATVR